jgi:hypothetical protein
LDGELVFDFYVSNADTRLWTTSFLIEGYVLILLGGVSKATPKKSLALFFEGGDYKF